MNNQIWGEQQRTQTWKLGAVAGLIAFTVYLLAPTRNYYWDGISFAQAIEDADGWRRLFHPNHLLYNLLGWFFFRALGRSLRALYVLQLLSSAFAGLAVYFLFGIVSQVTKSYRAAFIISILFAFSGHWWRFSTDANAYIPAVTLLIGCASLLVRSEQPRPVLLALLHTVAMAIHQLAVCFVPAAAFGLWHQRQDQSRARKLTALGLYFGLATISTIGVYAAGFVAATGERQAHSFVRWTVSHANDATFSWQWRKNAKASMLSWLQLFLSGRPALVRYFEPITVISISLCVLALVLLGIGLWRRANFRVRIYHHKLFWLGLVWFTAYAIFLFFWLPQNTFYKLFALPALILLLVSCWPAGHSPDLYGPGAMSVAALALANFTFAIIPYSRVTANEAVAFALSLEQGPLREGGVVYFRNLNTDDWLARYFNPRTEWRRADSTLMIDASLSQSTRVWLETTALEEFSATAPRWLEQRTAHAEWHELINSRHRIRFVRLQPGAPEPK